MKIAFTTSGDDLGASLESRFGRAPRFLIYDLDNSTYEVIDNSQTMNTAQGAGIQAAETIVHSGATALVTGHCGPKAFKVLSAAGIRVYNVAGCTVGAALEAFRSGQLKTIESADVEGHWV